MIKKIISVLFLYLLMYIVEFILVPSIYQYNTGYVLGDEGTLFSWFIVIVITLIGMIFCTDNLLIWFMCSFLYFCLLNVYIPQGVYGIGIWFGELAKYDKEAYFMSLLITAGVTLFWVFVVWCGVKYIKIMKKHFQKKK